VVELTLSTREVGNVTARDVELAGAITTSVRDLGLVVEPAAGRGLQTFEIAIDALDIPKVRPFWKAVLSYVDDPQGPDNALIDPLWQAPSFWFQQMDAPREQRNRIHFDISVAHDEAQSRLDAALAAGGALVSDAEAPSFWVLADPEGNEVCICTWQGRD
jgi:4a-hydroxytetrahydrobiopterin dehydratase